MSGDLGGLRAALRGRAPLRGLMLKMPSLTDVELAAGVADLVVIDLEHGPRDELLLAHHLAVAQAAQLPVLVRVRSSDPGEIGSVLDAGAGGIVVPHVESAGEAEAIVAAARYPPTGRRGWATSTRAAGYGRVPGPRHLEAAAGVAVVVQVESLAAADKAAEISAVDGIDAVFPGAADMAADAGRAGTDGGHSVAQAVDRVLAAAAARGIGALAVAVDEAHARALRGRGATGVLAVASGLVAEAFAAFGTWDEPADAPPASSPIVFVPGMLETDALWSTVAERLSPQHPPVFARIDLDDSIESLAETVRALAPETFVIAGHSLGGIIALEILRQSPQRVSAAVLVTSSARAPTEQQLAGWRTTERQLAEEGFAAYIAGHARRVLPASRHSDAELCEAVTDMARRTGEAAFARQLRAQQARRDLRPALRQITCPVLVVSSEFDEVCPTALQAEIAAATPQAQHHVVPDAGHLLPLEDPLALARSITNWWTGSVTRDPRMTTAAWQPCSSRPGMEADDGASR